MATYDLSGSGVQALTSGTTRLFLAVTAFPPGVTTGRAMPLNYYDVGLLRVGISGYVGPAFAVDAQNMWIDLPAGADSIGYALFFDSTVQLTESIPGPPPGGFVSSTADGLTVSPGDSITITWGDLGGLATPRDWLTIVPSGVEPDDTNGILSDGSGGWIYANSGTQTPGTDAVSDGSVTSVIAAVVEAEGNYILYYMTNDENTVLLQGPENIYTP